MAQPVHVMMPRTLVSQQNEVSALVLPGALRDSGICAARSVVACRALLRVLSGASMSDARLFAIRDGDFARSRRVSQVSRALNVDDLVKSGSFMRGSASKRRRVVRQLRASRRSLVTKNSPVRLAPSAPTVTTAVRRQAYKPNTALRALVAPLGKPSVPSGEASRANALPTSRFARFAAHASGVTRRAARVFVNSYRRAIRARRALRLNNIAFRGFTHGVPRYVRRRGYIVTLRALIDLKRSSTPA